MQRIKAPFALRTNLIGLVTAAAAAMAGCASTPDYPPITTAEAVDVDRFMGRWYVIAHIPTFIEDEAYNAVEIYFRRDADTVDTIFSFNNGAFDGKRKTYTPVGTVRPDTGGAVWGMQFVWPFKAEYRIVWVNADYSATVIGRSKRDYVWIMAREPALAPDVRSRIDRFLENEGYDLSKVREVPHDWPGTGP